jgi:hypothetical protein
MSTPPPRSCPICGAPAAAPDLRPFCSAACRDRDLIAWADEAYRVPVRPVEDDAEPGVADANSRRLRNICPTDG